MIKLNISNRPQFHDADKAVGAKYYVYDKNQGHLYHYPYNTFQEAEEVAREEAKYFEGAVYILEVKAVAWPNKQVTVEVRDGNGYIV